MSNTDESAVTGRSRDEVKSLERGIAVLRSFSEHHEAMTISEVAVATQITPASARRLLLTLKKLGYISQTNKRFRVTPKVLDLGYAYLSSMPIWQIAQPVLERISHEFSVSASAAVLEGADIVYVVRAPYQRIGSVLVSTGTRQPAHVTAIGQVLLASLEPGALDRFFAETDLKRYTPFSVTDPDELRKILKVVRLQNYALVDQELDLGLRALAVPIRDRRGNVVAAMNAACHTRSMEVSELVENVLPAMFQGAKEIGSSLAA